MATQKMNKAVRRITVLETSASGMLAPVVVYTKRRKRRKGSFAFRPLERVTRRLANASNTFTGEYLDRHNRANRRRRNGWVRRFDTNVMRAMRKGQKKLRLSRLLAF